jgi:hypothetical protein
MGEQWWKEAKSRSLTHKYDRTLSLPGTGTSIKRDGVKLVLWTQTYPLSEMMNTTHLLFIMACCYIYKRGSKEVMRHSN